MEAKVTLTDDIDYSCNIKATELMQSYGSISHHYSNSLGGTHKHIVTQTDICTETILRNQALVV